jgi:hypothetical protein
LLAGGAVFLVLDVLVVRPATEQSAFTRGVTRASLERPSRERAVYRVRLLAHEDKRSPSGARVAVHRWRIDRAARRPSEGAPPPIEGEDTVCIAESSGVRVELVLPLRAAEWGDGRALPVPARLRAVVPEANEPGARYTEWRVDEGQRADVVGCLRSIEERSVLMDCGDGAPSRVYLLPSRAVARRRALDALARVSAGAGAFALTCVIAGFVALRVWSADRT